MIKENTIYHLHVLRCNTLIELIRVYCLILCNTVILLCIGVLVCGKQIVVILTVCYCSNH